MVGLESSLTGISTHSRGNTMTKAIAYTRVSTSKQAESGDSLELQEDRIEQYGDLYDLEVVETFQDAGESGKNTDRPALSDALDELESSDVDTLVVHKLDRLTRSTADLGRLLERFDELEIDLVSVSEQLDTSSSEGRLVVRMLTLVSEWERERIEERTREALEAKRERGEYTGGDVPFGCNVDESGRLVNDDDERRTLEIIREYRRRGRTYAEIADELNRRDDCNRRNGNDWHKVAVSRADDSPAPVDLDDDLEGARLVDPDELPNLDELQEDDSVDESASETDDNRPTDDDSSASETDAEILETIRELRQSLSLRDVADELNRRNVSRLSTHGSASDDWNHVAVRRALSD
jgi:DNA invertase Pin-like site-specific DNA recombinase